MLWWRASRSRLSSAAAAFAIGPPRALHPVAWWAWAIGLATAATRTTNPLLLSLLIMAVALVVTARRPPHGVSRGLRGLLVLAVAVIAIRVVFRAVLGAGGPGTVLFTLPEIPLPEAAAGIRLGGAVTLEGVLSAVYDGLRLAAILVAAASANLLADARRLLKVAPPAIHAFGTVVVVAVAVTPRLVERGQRVRQARRLRGATPRLRPREVRATLLPVLEDALDGAIAQAAAMDVRGYGRRQQVQPAARRATAALAMAALLGLCAGVYGVLDGTAPAALGVPLLAVSSGLGLAAVRLGGRGSTRTVYRPDPWRAPEWATALCGVAVAAIVIVTAGLDPAAIAPATRPVTWPSLPPALLLAVVVAALPAIATPTRHVATPRTGPSTTTPTPSGGGDRPDPARLRPAPTSLPVPVPAPVPAAEEVAG